MKAGLSAYALMPENTHHIRVNPAAASVRRRRLPSVHKISVRAVRRHPCAPGSLKTRRTRTAPTPAKRNSAEIENHGDNERRIELRQKTRRSQSSLNRGRLSSNIRTATRSSREYCFT